MYRQIAAILRQRIDQGIYAPNDPIPSETDLCEEFSVSRKTARAAVRLLTEAGVTIPAPGKGVYVRPPT
jgi:DNA-binding GntR family transcriptional regulator